MEQRPFKEKVNKIIRLVFTLAQKKKEGEYMLIATNVKHAFRTVVESLEHGKIKTKRFRNDLWFLTNETVGTLKFKEFCELLELPALFKETKNLIAKEIYNMAKKEEAKDTKLEALTAYDKINKERKELESKVGILKKQEDAYLAVMGVNKEDDAYKHRIYKQAEQDNSKVVAIISGAGKTLYAEIASRTSLDEASLTKAGIDVSLYKKPKPYLKFYVK